MGFIIHQENSLSSILLCLCLISRIVQTNNWRVQFFRALLEVSSFIQSQAYYPKIPYTVFFKKNLFNHFRNIFRIWSKCLIELKIKLKGNPRQEIGYDFSEGGSRFPFQCAVFPNNRGKQLFRDKHGRITSGLKTNWIVVAVVQS